MTLSPFAIIEQRVCLFCVQANAKTHLYDVVVLLYCQGWYGAEALFVVIGGAVWTF